MSRLNNQFINGFVNKAFREHTDALCEYLGIFNAGGTAEQVCATVHKSRVV